MKVQKFGTSNPSIIRLNSEIFGFLTPVNETKMCKADIVEFQKSFKMISNWNLFPRKGKSKIDFSAFA